LKFFYEFRPIWKFFLNGNNLNSLVYGNKFNIDFTKVIDKSEVLYRFNNRMIQVDIEVRDLCFRFYITRVDNLNVMLDKSMFLLKGKELLPANIDPKVNINVKVFNSKDGRINIEPILEVFEILRKSIYIPAFRNVVNIGADQEYYDISIGEAFIRTFSQWKLGPYNWQNQIVQNVTEDIRNLFEYKNLEINPSDDRKNILLTIDGKVYKINEIGSGIVQFILVFLNTALKEPTFIFIDEPELNLHPTLQLKFLTSLASYTKNGVLFATHSIGLARSVADRIYSVFKKENSSIVTLLEKTPNYSELLGELGFTLYQELGVERILLVEGTTEVKTFHQFLRKIKKDKDFVVIPLGGNSMINGKVEIELNELKRIAPKIYCWIDSEKDSPDSPLQKERKEFLEICKKLGIEAVASERRAIENYFTNNAIKEVLGEEYGELNLYDKANWPKEKNWLIAQSMSFEEIKNTDLGKFFQKILVK
jgi:energy-coupling factor transporter ATP-binding protein EcfA2